MKNIFLLAIALFFVSLSFGQAYNLDPVSGVYTATEVSLDEESTFNVYIKNKTAEALDMEWKVIEETLSPWSYNVCDNFFCYQQGDLPWDWISMNTIDAAGQAFIKLNVTPDTEDERTLTCLVRTDSTQTVPDTVVFVVNTNIVIGRAAEIVDVNIFPTLVHSHFTIQSMGTMLSGVVKMVDMNGVEVLNHRVLDSQEININTPELSKGIYLVEYQAENGKVFRTKVMKY